MAVNDILTQDEIDALLHGVNSGEVETEAEEAADPGEARPYDFTSQDRIVRGRMPALDMINDRFARHFRISLFNLLRRSPEITVAGVQTQKFSEYMQGLFVPTSLNIVKVKPLRGTGLFVIDPKLVFILVDNFFGGDGRFHTKIEGREFTPTESRVIRILLDLIFKDMREAWRPVLAVDFEHLNSEVNPQFANIVGATEVVVVTTFHVELEGGGGDLHMTLPYSMIEPIRELLESGLPGERDEVDQRWRAMLREGVKDAEVELSSTLVRVDLTLEEVLRLKPGDVVPVELPEEVLLEAAGIPVFRGRFGVCDGQNAVQVSAPVRLWRPPPPTPLPGLPAPQGAGQGASG